MSNRTVYSVAGFRVASELPLPELLQHDEDGPVDIEIRLARITDELAASVKAMPEARVIPTAVRLDIPQIGRFLVRNGREITVDPEPRTPPADVRGFLLGSALGAVWLQRGLFPLHASAIVIDGAAIAFAGEQGAGKSTMAAWMVKQGCRLLCDDVCVIRFPENTDQVHPMVYPLYPRVKLWRDALDALEIDAKELQRDVHRVDKFHLPAKQSFLADPVPLRHIDFLAFRPEDSEPRIEDISPARAVPLLRDNTYRFQYVSGLELTREHFLHCIRLANSVPGHFLQRPRRHSMLAACQRLVEEQLR